MKIRVQSSAGETELLCCFVLKDSRDAPELGEFDSRTTLAINQSLKDMGGVLGRLDIIPVPGERVAQRILLAGLGEREDITRDTIRSVSGKIAQRARGLRVKEFSIITPSFMTDQISSVTQIVEGSKMALYKFDKFKTEKADRSPDMTIITLRSDDTSRAIKTAETVADGAIFTKSIGNLPPNECTPDTLADLARMISKDKMECSIISKSELKERGFGGITAVGQGSKNGPNLIVLEHNCGPKNERPIILVGKAVTFDAGGISLKPGEGMDEMKFDKCGGCTVLGIMKAVSELGLPVNVVGIIPSVENMPDGEAYRPGDIIKMYGGKTAEILNTDAEGRLILADALAYGEEHYSPRAIIDFATLTGACIIALGNNIAGMVTSDSILAERIMESSERTTEQIWRLPLNEDYMSMIESKVADMRNMGKGKAAGTITAAAFLRNAIKDTPWVHIDIAGVAWTQKATKARSYNPDGATGFGVRLILDYLQNLQD